MTDKDTEFLATARKRFEQAASDEKSIRDEAEKDLAFVAGDQWDEKVKNDRIKAGRPALTFARCHTFVQQVSNEARQNKPQIKFIPAEDGDEDTAEIYEGLARHIQYSSDAQVAYETAVEYSAGCSFGYYRFLTEYCDDDSWDQDLKVVPVFDPFSVYGLLIPACLGYEAPFGFIVESVPKEEFERDYPKSAITDWDEAVRSSDGWVMEDSIRIAEYWYVEKTPKTIKRKNPTSGEEETRTVMQKKVKFCKLNGMEVLPGSETEWPGCTIPVIPVLGKQLIVKGKPRLFSVVRYQRDPQQLLNYYKTRIAETLGTAPIQPYLIEEGQIEGHKAEWDSLNTTMRPYVTFKGVAVDGKPLGAPQRQAFEAPINSLSMAAAQEIDDMKATSGIFDASLGSKSNESSGIALQRRMQQSNVTNLHFMDNLERSFKKGGMVIAEVIPIIYDTERTVRILGEDEKPKIVKINSKADPKDNDSKSYQIGGDEAAEYDVVVTMGRAFSTKRMESFDMMSNLLQGNPQLLPMFGDILFKNSDVAGSDQLADRFQKMLPPNLQDQEDGAPEIPPQVKQQLDALSQQHEQLTQALNAAHDQIQQKTVENEAKIQIAQLQADIERMKIEASVTIAEITTKAQNERERMKLEMDLNNKLKVQDDAQAHETALEVAKAGHQELMANRAHEQAQQMMESQPKQPDAGAQQ
jgi:hypothetical protein